MVEGSRVCHVISKSVLPGNEAEPATRGGMDTCRGLPPTQPRFWTYSRGHPMRLYTLVQVGHDVVEPISFGRVLHDRCLDALGFQLDV